MLQRRLFPLLALQAQKNSMLHASILDAQNMVEFWKRKIRAVTGTTIWKVKFAVKKSSLGFALKKETSNWEVFK